ncbi:ESX-1 secretion-associated protein EspD [Mycobacterium marinum]|nr:ESX-1 secretion-associated protein EspD [Mycobacterium marinum]
MYARGSFSIWPTRAREANFAMLDTKVRRDAVVNLPGNDFDSDDFDAVDLWDPDGKQRWTADPIVGFAGAGAQDSEASADDSPAPQEQPEEDEIAVFTVTNPQGSVAVSALMDGRTEDIELSKKVARMSESQLASEILVLADLARQKAQAAQYAFILNKLTHAADGDQQRVQQLQDFVGNTWSLPSPEEAAAAEAEVFATRYGDDRSAHDSASEQCGFA